MPSGTQIGTLKPVVFLQANWFVMFCVMYFCYIFYRKPPSYFKCSGFWFLICPLNYFIWICVVYIITLWASIVQVWVSSQTYSCNILREIGMLNLKKKIVSFLFFWGGGGLQFKYAMMFVMDFLLLLVPETWPASYLSFTSSHSEWNSRFLYDSKRRRYIWLSGSTRLNHNWLDSCN